MTISQGETATNIETGEDNYVPPNTPERPSGTPTAQIARLKAFLAETFPGEVDVAKPEPEWAADTAIRLLTKLAAARAMVSQQRCTEPYCNQPEGHQSMHGWVVS